MGGIGSSGCPETGLKITGVSTNGLTNFLKGRLDLDRVAVAGHSYGGATAALVAASDTAFKAGICLDPWWVSGDVLWASLISPQKYGMTDFPSSPPGPKLTLQNFHTCLIQVGRTSARQCGNEWLAGP